ncbi:HTH-type transcriptional regulator GbpR [Pigmentiphaga humi]|uniref:HTH-type transcriptional regulator GbpR n=1 Tax=Pigmentiphaga humi TaxID=2478468 RepID=A0A3P4B1A3_9BURK|nr:LysR substrate-binding domain-containing protein [Pigmentiphaga humi]VCU69641.1 HTH-type transcriptional regulator GbpR [Pigmentiphaga humi]
MRILDPRLRLRHLQCLVALASHRSVLKAADALAQTPSAVSKSLAELEAIAGETLALRHRKGLEMTPAGNLLLRHAAQAMGALREGFELLGSGAQSPAHVRIGILPTSAARLVPQAIQQVRERYPNLLVSAHGGTNADLLVRLKLRELDLVIGRISHPSEMVGVSFEHLYMEPLAMAVRPGHPLLASPTADPAAVREFMLVLPMKGTYIRPAAETFLQSSGIGMPRQIVETLSSTMARALMHEASAIWFAPYGAIEPDLERGLAHTLPVDTSPTSSAVGLTTLGADELSDSARLFVDALRSMAGEMRNRNRRSLLHRA